MTASEKPYSLHLLDHAEAAYDREDKRWFYALPTEDLTFLWGVACVQESAWDDEVYDALAGRDFFDNKSKEQA